MSSAQSRARQRQRRRARERFWTAQQELVARRLDAEAYSRVLAHMAHRAKAETLLAVDAFRDEVRKDCERLIDLVDELKQKHEALLPVEAA